MKRLEKRGREEENSIPQEYLDQINQRHEEWFIEKLGLPKTIASKPTLIVDCSGDLINDKEKRVGVLHQVLEFADLLNKPKVSGG